MTVPDLDRTAALALVDAGYLPLSDYLAAFGSTGDAPGDRGEGEGAQFHTKVGNL